MILTEYIDRQAVLDAIPQANEDKKVSLFGAVADFIVLVNEIPAADVAPVVHGGWIPLLESEISGWNPEYAGKDPIGGYMCSVCKEEAIYDCNDEFVLSKFCPYCGAKMDGEG